MQTSAVVKIDKGAGSPGGGAGLGLELRMAGNQFQEICPSIDTSGFVYNDRLAHNRRVRGISPAETTFTHQIAALSRSRGLARQDNGGHVVKLHLASKRSAIVCSSSSSGFDLALLYIFIAFVAFAIKGYTNKQFLGSGFFVV